MAGPVPPGGGGPVPQGLAPIPLLQPTWGSRRLRLPEVQAALNYALPGGGCPERSRYQQIAYTPSADPLVRYVMLLREYLNMWSSDTNFAAVTYTTNTGETVVVIATSSTNGGQHSEEKLLQFLEFESRATPSRVGQIQHLYSERAPCIGQSRCCDQLLQDSPLFTSAVSISYSYPYMRNRSSRPAKAIESAFKRERDALAQAAALGNGVQLAQQTLGFPGPGTPDQPRFTLILPTAYDDTLPGLFDPRREDANAVHDEGWAFPGEAVMQVPRGQIVQ